MGKRNYDLFVALQECKIKKMRVGKSAQNRDGRVGKKECKRKSGPKMGMTEWLFRAGMDEAEWNGN